MIGKTRAGRAGARPARASLRVPREALAGLPAAMALATLVSPPGEAAAAAPATERAPPAPREAASFAPALIAAADTEPAPREEPVEAARPGPAPAPGTLPRGGSSTVLPLAAPPPMPEPPAAPALPPDPLAVPLPSAAPAGAEPASPVLALAADPPPSPGPPPASVPPAEPPSAPAPGLPALADPPPRAEEPAAPPAPPVATVLGLFIGSSGPDAMAPYLIGFIGPLPTFTDTAYGMAGNDTIWSDGRNQWLYGGTGNDILAGGGGDDVLWGEEGDDRLFGEGGADTLDGGHAGADTLVGGDGDDWIALRAGDLAFGGAGADRFGLSADGGTSVIADYDPSEDVIQVNLGYGYGPIAAVRVAPLNARDAVLTIAGLGVLTTIILQGAVRPDGSLVLGDLGAPLAAIEIDGGGRPVELLGTLTGSSVLVRDVAPPLPETGPTPPPSPDGPAQSVATAGDDAILLPEPLRFPDLQPYVQALGGNDTVWGRNIRDLLAGGDGDDVLMGAGGPDGLSGEAGNDLLFGGAGHDSLAGGGGADTLVGADGEDTLSGEAGDDLLFGGSGADYFRFRSGEGADTIADYDPLQDWIGLSGFTRAVIEVLDGSDALLAIFHGDHRSSVLLRGAVREDGVLEIGHLLLDSTTAAITIVAPAGHVQFYPTAYDVPYSGGAGTSSGSSSGFTIRAVTVDYTIPTPAPAATILG